MVYASLRYTRTTMPLRGMKEESLHSFPSFPDASSLFPDTSLSFRSTSTPRRGTTARDDFAAKLAIARKRSGPEETSAKKDARVVLADLLKQLAFHVTTTAAGNLTVLLSSGFRTTAYPKRGTVPAQPFGGLLVRGRQSGQLVFSVQKVPGKLYYEYRYGMKGEGDVEPQWGDVFVTTSSLGNVIAPVDPTVRYYAQARACNG